MADNSEFKSSRLARLSFILLNLLRKEETWSELENTWLMLNAKYPMHGLIEECASPLYAD